MAYTKYSLTPADNNAAPPDGAPEGMLPSAVNDTMRDMMAQIRDVGDGIRGGTYTMTAPVITGGSITGVALSGNTLTNPVITGGSINNTTVGATTPSTGAFTTLTATGATTFSGAVVANTFSSSGATITGGTINGTTVGATTPSTVKTTALTVTGATSGTLAIEATAVAGTNTATFPAATGTVMVSGNMPAFSAYAGGSQSIPANGTATKVSINVEEFDTNSNYDTSNFRFTPTVAGYYQINGCATILNAVSTRDYGVVLFKNGSAYKQGTTNAIFASDYSGSSVSSIVYFNGSTDYVELYCFNNSTGAISTVVSGVSFCYLNGAMVRAA